MDNYKSATNPVNRPMVEQTIRQEIALGNYVVSPTIVSVLGAIPKPNSTDCSHPHGQAVNYYITTNSFKFQTLYDATTLLRPNYYMAKIELELELELYFYLNTVNLSDKIIIIKNYNLL